jgi:hypothetical protein
MTTARRKKNEPREGRQDWLQMLQAQPSKGKKGDIQLGCLRRTASRREQCDMRPESCNLCICWAALPRARSSSSTRYTVTLDFDEAIGDISMVTTSKQTLTTDMKNRTVQKGDSYPSRLAGSCQFRSEVRRRRIRQNAGEELVTRQWIKVLLRTKQGYAERDSLSRRSWVSELLQPSVIVMVMSNKPKHQI